MLSLPVNGKRIQCKFTLYTSELFLKTKNYSYWSATFNRASPIRTNEDLTSTYRYLRLLDHVSSEIREAVHVLRRLNSTQKHQHFVA